MKHYLFLVGLLVLGAVGPPQAQAQAPAWQSARTVAVAATTDPKAAVFDESNVRATAVDAAGNVYLAGDFTNTITLGSITLTSAGYAGRKDLFVAKFSPATNQFVWAQQAGGTGYDEATALAVSGNSVYVTGSFDSPTADFGATTLTSAGGEDVFVAKLTDAGPSAHFAWAQRAGGASQDGASALAVSGSSVYVAGYFGGADQYASERPAGQGANFGPTTLTNAGETDLFVTKLTDAGPSARFAWAQRAGGASQDRASALAVSGSSVYVAGFFGGVNQYKPERPAGQAANFGPTTLTSVGETDLFVAKLTDAGPSARFAWAQRAGGKGEDIARALAVSGSNVYVTGYFKSPTADFGAAILTNAGRKRRKAPSAALIEAVGNDAANGEPEQNVGDEDVFVAKLTDAGGSARFAWAQQAGGTGSDMAVALAVRGTSVYVAGSYNCATIRFGNTNLANANGNKGTGDVFVAKLTDAGTTGRFAWAQRAGSADIDEANALAVSGTSVYVAGDLRSSKVAFGTTTLTSAKGAEHDIRAFLASLNDPAPAANRR